MTTPYAYTYTRVALASLGTAVAIALLGYFPTVRLAGRKAIGAMLAGIAISLVAGCISAIPIAGARSADKSKRPLAILMATTIRFLVALLLSASLLLSGWFDRSTLVLWIGISYLLMLCVETFCAVRILGPNDFDRGGSNPPGGRDKSDAGGANPRDIEAPDRRHDEMNDTFRRAGIGKPPSIPAFLPKGALI